MPTPFRRILVPHDFSSPANQALRMAAALARTHDGTLTVLHVIVPFYVPADLPLGLGADQLPPPSSLVPEQRSRLERMVAKVLGPDAPRSRAVVEVGDPARCILDAAGRADAIVMATAGRTGLAHLLIGSVAEKVVRHASVPVLTVRVQPRRRAAKRRG
jgi:nucleotide-binding universal stress UspA family protein